MEKTGKKIEKTWKFLFQKTTQPISTKLGKKLHGIKGFKFSNEFAVDTIINVVLFYFVIKGVGIIIILFKPVFFYHRHASLMNRMSNVAHGHFVLSMHMIQSHL